jgi:hypothetical protein
MQERGRHNLPQDMAVAYDYDRGHAPTVSHGKLETLLCAACGYTLWYARDFEPGDKANVAGPSAGDPCTDCGGDQHWFVVRMEERDSHGEPVNLRIVRTGEFAGPGRLSAHVCQQCGLLDWRAADLKGVEDSSRAIHHRVSQACVCGSHARDRIETFRETGDLTVTPLHVELRRGWLYTKAIGSFALEICSGCSRMDWFASGLESLRHDPQHGVALLERPAPPEGSPYR